VEAAYGAEIEAGPLLGAALSTADIAHAVALSEGGGIDDRTSRALLGGLLDLDAIPADEFPWRSELGDAFNSREALLTERIGPEAAGWLSAGRPRREAFRVALRLVARDGALAAHDASLDVASAAVSLAERGGDAVAADYTYLHAAQPTTVGHLLLTWAYPALRDAERFADVFGRLDASTAGAGGSAGSRWPIDRERLRDLLGHADTIEHTKDAAWQFDPFLELAGALAIAATHWSEQAQDLEIFASREFGVVELSDEHSRASALMPQKRNPYALVAVRAQAGAAAGLVSGMLVTLHTGTARTDHFQLLNSELPRALGSTVSVGRLHAAVLEGLTVSSEPLRRAAVEGFVGAADLADAIAIEGGVDYRTAYTIVGRAVRDLVDAGSEPSALDASRISAAAEAVTGSPLVISDDEVARALDPEDAAHTRSQLGSSNPRELERMVVRCRAEIERRRDWGRARAVAAKEAQDRLRALARDMAGVGGAERGDETG
jgi:argininosuccinate lyase